jgi:membrane-bound serine protease (ClpP class)
LLRALLAVLAMLVAAAPLVPRAALAQAGADGAGAAAAGTVALVRIDGPIGPATVEFVERALARAAADGAPLVVLGIDTPGGLASSTRDIVRAILASPVPVAAWVSPGGAHAASAGTYIVMASHVAAMAPAANLGAATPVAIGGESPPTPRGVPAPGDDTERSGDASKPGDAAGEPATDGGGAMARKVVNDSAAWLRALAQARGRNADWAERAVREGLSLSAEEALAQRVVDVVATDLPQLLEAAHGREVVLGDGRRATLEVRGAAVVAVEPDWRTRLLSLLSNPSIAYVLLLVGAYGIFLEVTSPGFGVPGVAGAVLLLTGLFGLQMLPLDYVGVALLLFGFGLVIAEALMPSFGVLGIVGTIAFVIGSVMLIDTEAPGYGIPWWLIGLVALINLAIVLVVARLALAARRRPVVSGAEELLGASGRVLEADANGGWARVHGERWRIVSGAPLRTGQPVRVVGRDGLELRVEPDHEPGPDGPRRSTP